jgi:hypothetical protein
MIPKSDDLEAFLERLVALDRRLAGLKGAEVRAADLVSEIKAVARDWLRYSEALKSLEVLQPEAVSVADGNLKAMLQATNVRTRSGAYQKKLQPVIKEFTDKIVVPVIRHEGSPSQVASRALLAEVTAKLTPEETAYLDEAARALAAKCNRAAIIMLWAAAIARMHRAIESVGFNTYNQAVDATVQKKGSPFNRVAKNSISSLPELQRCRDFDLLVVGMQLFQYDLQVYEELDRLLGTRNSAAHPGMLQPTALDVQQYATKLNACVFSVVPV